MQSRDYYRCAKCSCEWTDGVALEHNVTMIVRRAGPVTCRRTRAKMSRRAEMNNICTGPHRSCSDTTSRAD